MFANPGVFNCFFVKDNGLALENNNIKNITQFLHKLQAHKNEYLFTITRVFKGLPLQDKAEIDSAQSNYNRPIINDAETTISSLPAEIINYIASFLLPVDIKQTSTQISTPVPDQMPFATSMDVAGGVAEVEHN